MHGVCAGLVLALVLAQGTACGETRGGVAWVVTAAQSPRIAAGGFCHRPTAMCPAAWVAAASHPRRCVPLRRCARRRSSTGSTALGGAGGGAGDAGGAGKNRTVTTGDAAAAAAAAECGALPSFVPSALAGVQEPSFRRFAPRLRVCPVPLSDAYATTPTLSTCFVGPARKVGAEGVGSRGARAGAGTGTEGGEGPDGHREAAAEGAWPQENARTARPDGDAGEPQDPASGLSDDKVADLSRRAALQRLEDLLQAPTAQSAGTAEACGPAPGVGQAPLLLLHGFDSSCLEWRRLMPLLEQRGYQCWAVDVLGSGLTQRDANVRDLGPQARREHVRAFVKTVIKSPVVLVGASFGANVALDLAVAHPELVSRLILLDAPTYVEGLPVVGGAGAGAQMLQRLAAAAVASPLLRTAVAWLCQPRSGLGVRAELPAAAKRGGGDVMEGTMQDALLVGAVSTMGADHVRSLVELTASGGYSRAR